MDSLVHGFQADTIFPMLATLTKNTFTPTELLDMPNAVSVELVDGQLVERNVSTLSSLVAGI